jgi:hypothetical protein
VHLSSRFVEPNDMCMEEMTTRTHLISARLGLYQLTGPLEVWHASKKAFFVFWKKIVFLFSKQNRFAWTLLITSHTHTNTGRF